MDPEGTMDAWHPHVPRFEVSKARWLHFTHLDCGNLQGDKKG